MKATRAEGCCLLLNACPRKGTWCDWLLVNGPARGNLWVDLGDVSGRYRVEWTDLTRAMQIQN